MNGIITIVRTNNSHYEEEEELEDELESKSSAYKRAGSSPAFGTTRIQAILKILRMALFFIIRL